jgi:hypothetical protein
MADWIARCLASCRCLAAALSAATCILMRDSTPDRFSFCKQSWWEWNQIITLSP